MYTPPPNEETRVEVMHALVRAHPLGTLTLLGEDDLLTNHVRFRPHAPVLVHAKRWLHEDETPWFSPGDEPHVFEVARRRLAPAICFEALQHEHVDAVAALGATSEGLVCVTLPSESDLQELP